MITEKIESRLYHYLTHKILETPGARLHAIGGIETHIHIATSLQPNILVSDWVGKLKGSSSYYINHEVQPKALQWQRGYGIVTFGTKDLQWVIDYIHIQKEHHKNGTIRDRLESILAKTKLAKAAQRTLKRPFNQFNNSTHALKVRGYLPRNAESRLKPPIQYSEVNDEFAHGQATQVHLIFPENEHPRLAAYLENLIKLTAQQHYTRAHPNNNTHMIDRDYQLICLLAKSNSIEASLESGEDFYTKGDFVYVINEGTFEELVEENFSFDTIRARLAVFYNQN